MNRGTIMIIAATVMLTLLGGGFYYVGKRLLQWLSIVASNAHPKLIFTGVCALFFLSIAASFLRLDMSVKQPLVWFAWFLIGVFIYLLIFFLLSDIAILAAKLFGIIPKPVPTNYIAAPDYMIFALRGILGYAVIACVICTVAWGVYNASLIKHTSYTVSIGKKETTLAGLKIALVSDIHLGYLNDENRLAKIVSEINALEPDVVAMAGDIFNDNFNALPNPQEALRALRNIKSKYGVYACVGNHDVGDTYNEMVRFLEDGGVKVLQDEYAVIDGKFVIVGRKDSSPISYQGTPRKELSRVLEGVDMRMPVIVIDHNPSNIKEYGDGIDLVLFGHTHKGQMFPANIIAGLAYPVNHGHYKRDADAPHVIVTSGVGVWGPPFRIGTDNEVVSVLAEF